MKKLTFFLIAFSLVKAHAQFVHVIKADSVLITNDSSKSELNLENSTKNVKGFLYNKGNGRTEFRKFAKLNDSTLLFGGDTVNIGGNSKNFANTDLTFTGHRSHTLGPFDLEMNGFDDYGNTSQYSQNEYGFSWSNSFYTYRNSNIDCGLGVARMQSNTPDSSKISYVYVDTNRTIISTNHSVLSDRVDNYITVADSTVIGCDSNQLPTTLKFYLKKLPQSASSSDSILVRNSAGRVMTLAQSAIAVPITLQQVTGYGNTTSNTIKPYPSALPIGSNSDSVVVWSASDSLLKKIGSKQTFAQTSTVTVSATDVQTTLTSSGAGSLTIPAASWFVGKTYKVVLHGTYSTSSTNPASLTIKIKLGTTVVAQGSFTLAANKTDVAFECRNEFTCRATGASGTVFSMGMMRSADNIVTKLNNGTSPTSVTLSTSQDLNITAQLSNNVSGNSVSAYLILLEAMN